MCVFVCVRSHACFPYSCKSPAWHIGSVGKQQVWDALMAFTDGFRTLPMGGLLLHLLIYSFSTAVETLRSMWLFPRARAPPEPRGIFLSGPRSSLPPLSPCPIWYVYVCACVCVRVCFMSPNLNTLTGWLSGICHSDSVPVWDMEVWMEK